MPSDPGRNMVRAGLAVLLVASLVLGGCAALVVGGGAAGSYPSASGADNQRSADEKITAGVRAELSADRMLAGADITVSTVSGVVTLVGVVSSYSARSQAETLAASVGGVAVIDNRLKIKNSL